MFLSEAMFKSLGQALPLMFPLFCDTGQKLIVEGFIGTYIGRFKMYAANMIIVHDRRITTEPNP